MNSDQSKYLKCNFCTYNQNSPQARHCELCGNLLSLVPSRAAASLSSSSKSHRHPGSTKNFVERVSSKNKTQPTNNSVSYPKAQMNSERTRSSDSMLANRSILSKAYTKASIVLLVLGMLLGAGMAIVALKSYIESKSFQNQHKNFDNHGNDIKLYDTMSAVPNVPSGVFSYGGALCFAALKRDGMNAAINQAHPSFRLRYVEPKFSNPGCTTGIRMLLERELTIAQNSRPLSEEEINIASTRGYELESVPVAIDGIVFYTHKSLGIKYLSLDQLRDIYSGKIKNWKELGGFDLPITPVSLDPKIDSILQLLMKTENSPTIGKNGVIVRDFTTAIRTSASTPGAISYASSAILRGQQSITPIALSANGSSPPISALLANGAVNLQAFENNLYPLTRRLFVVIRRDGTPEETAGVAYTNLLLSQEGQKIFKQAGFVPLYFLPGY